jgi:hypothetical protein
MGILPGRRPLHRRILIAWAAIAGATTGVCLPPARHLIELSLAEFPHGLSARTYVASFHKRFGEFSYHFTPNIWVLESNAVLLRPTTPIARIVISCDLEVRVQLGSHWERRWHSR